MFLTADGFGYDFSSSSSENDTNIDYYLALENLQNVMSILDELYPNENSINLVDMCKNRFKELNLGII